MVGVVGVRGLPTQVGRRLPVAGDDRSAPVDVGGQLRSARRSHAASTSDIRKFCETYSCTY